MNPAQAWADPPYTKCADKVVLVRPHKGDALLFFSLDPEDKLGRKSHMLGRTQPEAGEAGLGLARWRG